MTGRFALLFSVAVALALGVAADGHGSQTAPSAHVAFVDVSVVPMDRQAVLDHQTVLVAGDRIVAIGPVEQVEVPATALRIDGTGKYLMPGLIDAHVHAWREDHLQLYVANGITSVRNLWGGPVHFEWRQRMLADPAFVAPTIYTAGPLIDGDPPIWGPNSAVATTPEQGRALVQEHADAGYDFIKVYNLLHADVYEAILAAATERGLTAQGHVPNAVGLLRVLGSGQRAIEHFSGYQEATYADAFADAGDFSEGWRERRLALAERLAAGELKQDDIFDPARIERVVRETVQSGVWNIPTVVVNSYVAPDEYAQRATAAGTQYLDADTLARWNPSTPRRGAARTSDQQRAMRHLVQGFARRMIGELHRAGANLLVGTDTPNPFVLPGFAIHEELAHFVQAGLTPYETLERATRIPAGFIGQGDDAGVVAVGRRADLLLLDADPLADVANVQRLAGVSLRGRWLSGADIEAMLESIEQAAAATKR